MYCGDETGSFIGDIGSYSSRFGYGGNNVPSYVIPSMVLTQQLDDDDDNRDSTSTKKIIHQSSIPTSCYNYKYGHPPNHPTWVYDYRSPLRRAAQQHPSLSSSSSYTLVDPSIGGHTSSIPNTHTHTPITDPTHYLQQGDSIEDWDAYEHIWMNAIHTMSVQNTYKHTTGRVETRNGNQDGTTSTSTAATTHSSALKSTMVRSSTGSSTTAYGDHRCTHPFLVISPGMTHSMHCATTTTTAMNADNVATASLSARNRGQMELLHLTELMMETFEATAMFIAPTPMLASFAHGRQTSLLVDIGAGGTRVTPVVDGLLLKQSQRRSGRGTDWLQNCIWQALLQEQEQSQKKQRHRSKTMFHLTPRYQIKHQRSILSYNSTESLPSSSSSSSSSSSPPHHDIFHRWAMNDLMYEIRTSEHVALPHWWYDPSVPFIYDDDDDDDANGADAMTIDDDDDDDENDDEMNTSTNGDGNHHPQYELPDGTRIQLSTRIGKDICRVPELFFSEQCPFILKSNQGTNKNDTSLSSLLDQHVTLSNAPLHQLIHQSLGSVADVDLRRELASSIVLTGGGSVSLPNLASRLSLELPRITSSAYKTKVIASGYGTTIPTNHLGTTGTNPNSSNQTKSHQSTSMERQCAAWIGGSILSSLGSFQQLWLSKAEYDEYGGTLALQRFP